MQDIFALKSNDIKPAGDKKGFQILERNFYTRFGEIDIIAMDRDYLSGSNTSRPYTFFSVSFIGTTPLIPKSF